MKTKMEVCFKDTDGVFKRIICDEVDRGCRKGDSTLAESMERGPILCKDFIGTSWKHIVEMEPKQLSWIRIVRVKKNRKVKHEPTTIKNSRS